jgi:hypothetical protein
MSMCNPKINSLKLLLSLGISVLTTSLYAKVNVYLENNYGATLNYKTSSFKPEGERIGHNVRISLGDVDYLPELSIRTTGTGSSYVSYYYSLNTFLTDIKMQQTRHQNDDAIIIVEPSRVNWYIILRWEPKTKGIKPFESLPKEKEQPVIPQEQPVMQKEQPIVQPQPEPVDDTLEKEEALMELKTAEERLNAIKNGALGSEFAHKAKAICDANYTQAEKLGKINLCSELKRNVVAPTIRPRAPKISPAIEVYGKHKRPVSADLAPAIDEIKSSINRLYSALERYKTRGEATD